MAPPPPLPAPTTQFIAAITRVAVSQICRSVGYDAAEGGALAALTSVAALYLRSLATNAASSSTSSGRTQPNLLDLASAIDSLASHRGFPGGSDHRRPILSSSAVRDVIAFAAAVEEVPFAGPIEKQSEVSVSRSSYVEAGRDPPSPWVPPWLPMFPESEGEIRVSEEVENVKERCFDDEEKKKRRGFDGGGDLPLERGRLLSNNAKV
ncbi:hypothetical protein QJS04_geneDACA004487 [Acorus gramineus]|uniref:Bromodomain associated domain-containing protein n=1 Tax=Acorus gramineus TaxID=55184 RepID=A0AAV9B4P7_ACOGR|nr:hypothetical protein QJS04_geneDACA004487 [Acorus gramineus]